MINMRKNMRSQKGFTLIELMMVVAIIGILAAIAVPSFSQSSDNAKEAKIRADLRTLDSAHMIYIASGNTAIAKDGALTPLAPNYVSTLPVKPSGFSGAYIMGDNNRVAYKNGTTYEYADAASFTK